jgi:hypothetical protein
VWVTFIAKGSRAAAVVVLLAVGVTITGCTGGGSEPPPTSPAAVAPSEPAEGYEYTLLDGTEVIIDPTQELSDEVKADIAANAAPRMPPAGSADLTDLHTYLAEVHAFTGVKTVLLVCRDEGSGPTYESYAYDVEPSVTMATTSREEAIAGGDTWAELFHYQLVVAC